MKFYIVSVRIDTNEWDFKIGDIVKIPSYGASERSACKKIEDDNWGSEYPSYTIMYGDSIEVPYSKFKNFKKPKFPFRQPSRHKARGI